MLLFNCKSLEGGLLLDYFIAKLLSVSVYCRLGILIIGLCWLFLSLTYLVVPSVTA